MGISTQITLPSSVLMELADSPNTATAIKDLYAYLRPVKFVPQNVSGITFPSDAYGFVQKLGGFAVWHLMCPTGYTMGIGKGIWGPPLKDIFGVDAGTVIVQCRYRENATGLGYWIEKDVRARGTLVQFPDPAGLATYTAGDPIYFTGITTAATL
jgi:hypothetical protein